MISKNEQFKTVLSILWDYVLVVLSYLISNYIRFNILDGSENNIYSRGYYNIGIASSYAVLIIAVLYIFKTYKHDNRYQVFKSVERIVGANVFVTTLLLAAFYMSYLENVSRMAMMINFFLCIIILSIKRLISISFRKKRHQRGIGLTHVVLIGGSKLAVRYYEEITKRTYLGICIDGYVASEKNESIKCDYLGDYDSLDTILLDSDKFEAVVAIEAGEIDKMNTIIAACDKCGTRFAIIPVFNDYLPHNATIDNVGRSKLINVRETPFDFLGNAIIKRTFDILGSLILIILSSPVLIACAIGVKLSSPGPVIFKQERVGLNKKTFNMYKFRSMRLNVESSTAWSTDEDPRKTKFGSFIRKFSLDELPQFFNVLKGDMSLVGPRPEIPFHVSHFKDEIPLYLVRQQVRPGCTGWAQIHGLRGDTDIKERIEHDIWYIEHWSLWLDIMIIFDTVLGGKMANNEKLSK